MGFHDDKLLIEDTFRLSGLEMSEDLDSLVQTRQKPQYEQMTDSGLNLNEEFEQVMSILGGSVAKKVHKPQKLSEAIEEAGGPAGMGSQDEPWKVYVNGEFVEKTKHVASLINSYEQDGLDVDEEWDSENMKVFLTVNMPSDDDMDESCGKKHQMKEDDDGVYADSFKSVKAALAYLKKGGKVLDPSDGETELSRTEIIEYFGDTSDFDDGMYEGKKNDMDEDREDKTNPKPKYDENPSKDSYAKMAMEGKDIYDCLNGLIECLEQGTNFCLNLSEDANKTRKQVSAWLESRILPKMEGVLDEMEPRDEDGMPADMQDPADMDAPEGRDDMDNKPEGEGEPEGEERDYDEKEELKYVEELDNVVQALKISLEKIDDEETRLEIEKLADNTESIVKDLQKMHGVETDSEDEGEGDDIGSEEGSDDDSEEGSEEVTEAKVLMDDDIITAINSNNWEEIVGTDDWSRGTEFTLDGQKYKVIGQTGDMVDVKAIGHE